MSDIPITKTEKSRWDSINWEKLGFGIYFSDHVFVVDYKNGQWTDDRIIPYGPMEFEPALCTLHYAQSLFDGLKAYPAVDGKHIHFFRPEMNAARMNNSAQRICIPEFGEERFLLAMDQLVKLDKEFVPKERGQALYIRPVMFGTSNFLGVHASEEYRLIIMTSPVGSYYPEGLNPVKILVEKNFVRATPGGTGNAKVAGNYAASLLAGERAKKNGFAQVLWLNAENRSFVDEVGAMNIMFVIDDELITPSLDGGTILPGVTRDSVLHIAREWGMRVSERDVSIEEVIEAKSNGKLQEVFGTGTAAVISPVGLLHYEGEDIVINDMKIGEVSQKLYDEITGIQYGEIEDRHGWVRKLRI